MNENDRDFSSLATGYAAVVRISTVSAQAALCEAFGYWVDRRWETAPWGTVVGALLGAAAFGVGLVAAVKRLEREDAAGSKEKGKPASSRRRDKAAVDAEIAEEASKTNALREELRAAFSTKKSLNSLGESETERRR
ncbi:MAG: AtpZ/AtpI family protein [Thermoguttaceae bacterium]|nr:AtpZ/AtpI family protein [Thermoguttaceae bacterium]